MKHEMPIEEECINDFARYNGILTLQEKKLKIKQFTNVLAVVSYNELLHF